ncbi:MAG: ABC transporter permease [Clostridiales bacterium]|nr:ABC transporter permease [Clostridiales bacterium]
MDRTVKAIIKKLFFKQDRLKTQVPNATFLVSVGFVAMFSLVMLSLIVPWLRYFYFDTRTNDILVVNAPDSYIDFIENEESGRYPFGKVITNRSSNAYYDFLAIGKWLHKEDAFMAIVFPDDFDYYASKGQETEVLTYCRTDSLDYIEWKDYVIDEHLDSYRNYLRDRNDIPVSENDAFIIKEDAMTFSKLSGTEEFIRAMAKNVFPICTFIIILYVSMSVGTNAIAGEKERGTFTGIIMTPAPRRSIALGNILGVALNSYIPAFIGLFLMWLLPPYRSLEGLLYILLLTLSLALLIASVTILISVMNDNVISAQTAFLPIFLVLIAVCVSCMQEGKNTARLFNMIPVYGHFYGMGKSLLGEASLIDILVCTLVSLILSGVCVHYCVKLLSKERFTASIDTVTAKELKQAKRLKAKLQEDFVSRPRAVIFGYRPKKRTSLMNFISDQIMYPLALLSVFQMIAVIPTIIRFMKKPEYTDYIASLQDVTSTKEIILKSFEVMNIFMSDPVFLILFGIGYILMIDRYIHRVTKKEKNSLETIGFKKENAVRKYLTGLLVGFIMITGVFLLLNVTGQIKSVSAGIEFSCIPLFIAYLFMWIPQGATEEIMFRGFMMSRVASRFGLAAAMFFQSLMFALFHGMNIGFTPLAGINLLLIALFFGLWAYYSESIWSTCAAHTIWNLSQGNIYGLQVSGNQSAASILSCEYYRSASDLITGGAFGPEGGLCVTAVSLIAIAAVVIFYKVIIPRKTPSAPKA